MAKLTMEPASRRETCVALRLPLIDSLVFRGFFVTSSGLLRLGDLVLLSLSGWIPLYFLPSVLTGEDMRAFM